VALVDFCAVSNAKIPINGRAFGVCRVEIALQAIFGDFKREAQQTPGSLWRLWIFAPSVTQKSRLMGVLLEFAG
jgi:hypothetical protein